LSVQAEEQSVTELQTKAQPNKAILNKLREEMTRLYTKQVELVAFIAIEALWFARLSSDAVPQSWHRFLLVLPQTQHSCFV